MEKSQPINHDIELKAVDDWIKTLGPDTDPIEVAKKKIRRKHSTERKEELSLRAQRQRSRIGTYVMPGVKASINRRSNDPHMHVREKARNIRNGKVKNVKKS